MNILHAANFHLKKHGQAYYCTDRKITNGLIRAGHFVYDFSYRDVARSESFLKSQQLGSKKMNTRFLSLCEAFEPDLILIGKGELLSLQTLKKLRQEFPETRVALWHFDAIYITREIDNISDKLEYLDAAFFTTGGKHLGDLRSQHDNKVYFFPNPVDYTVETLKNFLYDNFSYDVMYCGRDYKRPYRRRFFEQLSAQSGGRMRLSLNGILGCPPISGREYLKAIRQSPMGLNISDRSDIEYYSSDRIAQLTGNGMCTFSPRVPKFESLYKHDELVYFDDHNDLVEKLVHYKEHPEERKQIAKAGWQRAHDDYSSTRISRYFIDSLFGGDLSQYHWSGY